MQIRHMPALTKLTSDKTYRLNHTVRLMEGRIFARAAGDSYRFCEGDARRCNSETAASKTHSLLSWKGLDFTLDSSLLWVGRRLPQRLTAPSRCDWLVLDGVGASRSLNRLAPAWFHAQSLQPPTTHHPQRPCCVLQASNSPQQLDVVQSLCPSIRAPAVWAPLRFRSAPRVTMVPSAGSSTLWSVFCTLGRTRDLHVRPRDSSHITLAWYVLHAR
jgi:hypothetical protein